MPLNTFTPSSQANSSGFSLDQLNAMTTEKIPKTIKDTVYKSHPVLAMVRNLKQIATGPDIVQPLRLRESTGYQHIKGATQNPVSYTPTDDKMKLDFALTSIGTMLSIDDVSEIDGDAEKLGALGARIVENMSAQLMDGLAYDFFIHPTGTIADSVGKFSGGTAVDAAYTGGPNGLCEAVATSSTAGTYAGFSGTTYTGWAPQWVSDTVATLGAFNKMHLAVRTKGSVTGKLMFISNMEIPVRLFGYNVAAQTAEVKTDSLNMGYSFLSVNGVDLMVDFHAPSNTHSASTIKRGLSDVTNPLRSATTGVEQAYLIHMPDVIQWVKSGLDLYSTGWERQTSQGVPAFVNQWYLKHNWAFTNRRNFASAVFLS